MNRILPTAIISLAIFVFAAYEGWLSYESNPLGIFLYTPNDWCAPRTHSFSVAYGLILIVAGLAAAVIALTAWLVFYFAENSKVKSWSKCTAHISLLLVPALIALFLISPAFEAAFPLQPNPACKSAHSNSK